MRWQHDLCNPCPYPENYHPQKMKGFEMKTSKLRGAALDWAVAKCEGRKDNDFGWWWDNYKPSTNWAHGGPIIERKGIQLARVGNVWEAWVDADGVFCQGPTPLIAAMRCHVTSELGETIEIPKEFN